MEKEPIWKSEGCILGMRCSYEEYTLYDDYIQIRKGVFGKKSQIIQLHRIMAKECYVSLLGRIFKYGRIDLFTRGTDIPNGCLFVKNPEEVLTLIEDTGKSSREAYQKAQREARKSGRYNNSNRNNSSNQNNYNGDRKS